MSDATTNDRALPIAAAHREFTVKVEGTTMPREHQLLAVGICNVANRIATARLVYLDGNAASSAFPLADADLLKPGKKIEISAGAGSSQDALFSGIVVRIGTRVRDKSAPQLVVECRHAASKLTVARRNKSWFDTADSDIVEELLGELAGDIDTTSLKHKQQVQFHSSDWDFLISRVQANGLLAWAKEDKIVVKKPAVGAAVCTLQFGATLLEFDAEIDARQQFSAVKGISWDPAQQALVQVDATDPSFAGPGNFDDSDLAAVAAADAFELRHSALPEAEVQAWADGEWLRTHINKVGGRGKCEGIGSVHTGDTVTLTGVGARFNGDVLVTGVRHDFDLVQGWKTNIQFGGIAPAPVETIAMPPAGGLLAQVSGLQIGVVTSNEDPDGEHRVRVRLPLVNMDDDGIWARVASLDAGDQRGFFFRPEIGDEVVVGFLDADPRRGVILGMLHSSAKAAPLQGSDDNNEKAYVSRAKMRLYFNDDKKVLTIDTPAGNSIALSEEDKSIVIADQNNNKITMNSDGISIESDKALMLKAGTEVKMESTTGFSAKGGTELKLEGSTSAELSSSAMTKLKGSMVQIN